eukprot:CAMPEP_0197524000 /NCGR_PEP_ID=MMETSP1318-20131121/8794_1 /TAXON_ID=552666 /ORGANISM="Partenskyella glossopodia, Strain RCC365" /LENGTH=328 /DNA_ID=CAMNT_0043076841 /DNA_START=44 /DNA_END=1033 /DNA_ORIENTATION=-
MADGLSLTRGQRWVPECGSLSYEEFCAAAEALAEDGMWNLREPKPETKEGEDDMLGSGVSAMSSKYLIGPEQLVCATLNSEEALSDPEPEADSLLADETLEAVEDLADTTIERCRAEGDESVVVIRHEIVYQHTYCVPMMLLRAYTQDGSPVALDAIEEFLQKWKRKSFPALPETKYFLLPQEHPVDGRPVFALKICRLNSLMSLALRPIQTAPTPPVKKKLKEQQDPSVSSQSHKVLTEQDSETKPSDVDIRGNKRVSGLHYLLSWLGIVGPFVGLHVNSCKMASLLQRTRRSRLGDHCDDAAAVKTLIASGSDESSANKVERKKSL